MVTLSQNVSLRLESVNSPIRSRAIIISSESTHLKKTETDLFDVVFHHFGLSLALDLTAMI